MKKCDSEMTAAEILLDVLETVRHEVAQPNKRKHRKGICHAIDEVLTYQYTINDESPLRDNLDELTDYLFISWDYYSGNLAFPVPCPNGDEWFYTAGELSNTEAWLTCPLYQYFDPNTEYGLLRLDLLDYMIEELEKHV